jgi:hypothetical protein
MTHDPYAPPPEPTAPATQPAPQSTYGAPLYTVPPLRSAAGLGTAAIVLACVLTAVQVVVLLLAPEGAAALRAAGEVGMPAYQSQFTAYDAVNLLYGALQVACYIVTCLWLSRSRATAVAANPTFTHERSPVWSWLGWWVPIVSLWFPYQVVRDIHRSTSRGPVSGIGGWWAAWLVYFIASRMATRAGTRLTPEATLQGADQLVTTEFVATFAMVVALVLWIRIIRDVTRFQAERIAVAERQLMS